MRTIILDNEAVQAVMRVCHPKHRIVMAHLSAATGRRSRGEPVQVMTSAAVRVEAGWDRRDPRAATVNRLRVVDCPLDSRAANTAAAMVRELGLSVADAHTGFVASNAAGHVVVLTSDPEDIRRAVNQAPVTIVAI
jgi:hypothetical protein